VKKWPPLTKEGTVTLTQPQVDAVLEQVKAEIGAGQYAGQPEPFHVDATRISPPRVIVPPNGVVVWLNQSANVMRVELPDEIGEVKGIGPHAYVHVRMGAPLGTDLPHWVYSGATRTQAGSDPRIIIR
jgi:hypothetical protein